MNRKHLLAAIVVAAFSGSLMAETIVTVNGNKIDSSEIGRRAAAVQAQSQGRIQDGPELRRQLTAQLVEETVIVQEAKRLGLDKSKEFKEAEAAALKEAKAAGHDKQAGFKQSWEDFRNRLLVQSYAADVIRKNPVSDAQIQQRHQQIKARYDGQQEVQLGEIVTDKSDQAQAAIKELGAKKSFADVARKYSLDPEVKVGGSALLDYLPLPDLQQNRPRIYQAVGSLKKGEFTRQPLSDNNIHVVFYVNDKRAIQVPALDDQMRNAIGNTLADERIGEKVGELMQKAVIQPAAQP